MHICWNIAFHSWLVILLPRLQYTLEVQILPWATAHHL